MANKLDLRASMKRAARPASDAPTVAQTGRQGKVNIAGYFPPIVKTQLRMLGAERSVTIQQQLAEALNDYFAKYKKPEIVPLHE